MFTLRVTVGGGTKAYPLKPGDTVLGRGSSSDIVLSVPSVSRQHARFRVEADRCYVTDLGSRCGTLRAGQPVTGEVELRAGEQLAFGEVAAVVESSGTGHLSLTAGDRNEDFSGTLVLPVDRASRPGATAPAADATRLLALLSEIGRTLVSVRPLGEVLDRVVSLTFDVLPNERAFLLLKDDDAGALVPRVLRNRDGSAPAAARLSRTVLDTVMRDRVAMLAGDAASDPRLDSSQSVFALKLHSFMCAPLWNRDDVIGVVYVDAPEFGRFAAADLEVFTALANYAAVAIEQARLADRLLAETRQRERLQRYHSPGVVDRILQAGDESDTTLLAQEREVTVLFCDIVSFTTLSEGMEPRDIVSVLNGFFGRMADVIFEFDGTLDKFIGDGLMAVFGAPFDQPDHAIRAVRAAQAMRRALDAMNEDEAVVPLEMRVAIATGRAMTGDIGSPRRREFTVLGDVVNTAARIQAGVARPGQIVIAESTWERVRDEVRATPLGSVSLRGRIAEVAVYAVAVS